MVYEKDKNGYSVGGRTKVVYTVQQGLIMPGSVFGGDATSVESARETESEERVSFLKVVPSHNHQTD